MGLEQMAINMARCNLDNALAIITSDEFRETGEYKLKGWQKLLEGGKEKYTREYLTNVIRGNTRLLRALKQDRILKELERKYNVKLDEFL